jgi:hypothetical protein
VSVISLTLTQSAHETLRGIPDTITVSTNIPAVVFFTIDGTLPNTNSSVYVSPIRLPSSLSQVTLNVLATDGTNTSSVVSQTFTGDLSSVVNFSGGAKFPQATQASIGNSANGNSLFPFGTTNPGSNTQYTGVGSSANTIYDQSLPSVPNGYDESGNPASFSNDPIDVFGAPPQIKDKNVSVIGKNGPIEFVQEFSSNNDKLFNPKALVIYHDASNTDLLTPTIINRPHFSLENPELIKDGILLSTHNLNSPTITGSFIKSHYNPNTGTMKTYYRDSAVNRWIISEWQYTPTEPSLNSFSNLVFGREPGSVHVYPWHLWMRRTLM